MKTIKNIFLFSIILISISCGDDFLEPVPTASINGEDYPSNQDELETLLVSVYDALQGVNFEADQTNGLNHGIQYEYYITEMISDNTRSKSGEGEAEQSNTFTIQSTNGFVFDYYKSMYQIIFRANLILENLDVATDEGSRIEGEARFMRAYAYFNLVRSYGDVPLIDRVITPEDEDVQFFRTPSADVYDFIIVDFEAAIELLGTASTPNRASRPAAQGLLAKVYLTLGTNYVTAQSLLETIINSESYILEPDFKDIFYNEANGETIFSVGFIGDNTNESQSFSTDFEGSGRSSGNNYATDDAIAAINEFGGDRTPLSIRPDPNQPSETQVVKYLTSGDASLDIPAVSTNVDLGGNDWIVLRYADILLMHVEAIIGNSTTTNVEAGLTSFQLVRDRAGLTDIVNDISKNDLLLERRIELAFENHRLHDLKRFGVAQEVLSAYSDENALSFNATDLLLPIPQFEINLSDGVMQQNPGY